MTLRAAIYARYSSDSQSEASIEDQFRICREHAAREQWTVVGAYHDAAISGASVILRPGVQRLLQDAQRGKFEVVLAEALDRVSRDQADVATLFKHLRFAGVQIITLSEGEITELHVGLKGTMNALFLKDLAAKTHRGLRGRIEAGKSAGGRCYCTATMSSDALTSVGIWFEGSAQSIPQKQLSCSASLPCSQREQAPSPSRRPSTRCVFAARQGVPGVTQQSPWARLAGDQYTAKPALRPAVLILT
jgi:DNA invertase Pin-like site-specific DNA recombinase